MGNNDNKVKDKWDKADVILKPVGGLLTALAITAFGFITSAKLEHTKNIEMRAMEEIKRNEMRTTLYSELMSKREEAESALRKDMFKSIIDSFFKPESDSPDKKVLNLELLAYNFHESLNLKPLFAHLQEEIASSNQKNKKKLIERLEKVAKEITWKQKMLLMHVGRSFDRNIMDHAKEVMLDAGKLNVNGIEREYKIHVYKADAKTRQIRLDVTIVTHPNTEKQETMTTKPFTVGYFDFPMIDNTRLSDDQRFAVIMNDFNGQAQITLICFPGSYASLKDKPFYEDVLEKLKNSKS
ncbi:MAG: hypothetical protein HZA14_05555 [Nitrospirae bacterium]|nr:hypothetical protein [Nitrospirota bacterium]